MAPDVTLLDLNLRRICTMEVVRRVRDMAIPTKTAVMSSWDRNKTVVEALTAGAKAYLLKTGSTRQIQEAFEQILTGGMYLSPLLALDEVFRAAANPGGSAGDLDRSRASGLLDAGGRAPSQGDRR